MSTTPINHFPQLNEVYEQALKTQPKALYDAVSKVLKTDNFEEIANFINLMTCVVLTANNKM